MADKKLIKHKITANKRLDLEPSKHEDGEQVGTLELPEGVDPARIINGLKEGHLIIGDKPAPRKDVVKAATDDRAKPVKE